MERRQKISIWYVLLGIWIVLIFQNYMTTMFAIKMVPCSEFLKLLKENKVTEVAISANQIQGKIKENATGKEQMFRTVRVVAGLEKKNRLINPREREIVAYHEMGHALVAISLPGTDPVQKISIIPRGIAALGYTMQTPTEDRFLMNKSELLNRIATLLGGRAAEDIVFEDIST
jgi:cell division protease FtsH